MLDRCPAANLQGGKSDSLCSVICNLEWFSAAAIPLHTSRCWCCLGCQIAMGTTALTPTESSSSAPSLWAATFIHARSFSFFRGSTCTTKVQGRLCRPEVGQPAHVDTSCIYVNGLMVLKVKHVADRFLAVTVLRRWWPPGTLDCELWPWFQRWAGARCSAFCLLPLPGEKCWHLSGPSSQF